MLYIVLLCLLQLTSGDLNISSSVVNISRAMSYYQHPKYRYARGNKEKQICDFNLPPICDTKTCKFCTTEDSIIMKTEDPIADIKDPAEKIIDKLRDYWRNSNKIIEEIRVYFDNNKKLGISKEPVNTHRCKNQSCDEYCNLKTAFQRTLQSQMSPKWLLESVTAEPGPLDSKCRRSEPYVSKSLPSANISTAKRFCRPSSSHHGYYQPSLCIKTTPSAGNANLLAARCPQRYPRAITSIPYPSSKPSTLQSFCFSGASPSNYYPDSNDPYYSQQSSNVTMLQPVCFSDYKYFPPPAHVITTPNSAETHFTQPCPTVPTPNPYVSSNTSMLNPLWFQASSDATHYQTPACMEKTPPSNCPSYYDCLQPYGPAIPPIPYFSANTTLVEWSPDPSKIKYYQQLEPITPPLSFRSYSDCFPEAADPRRHQSPPFVKATLSPFYPTYPDSYKPPSIPIPIPFLLPNVTTFCFSNAPYPHPHLQQEPNIKTPPPTYYPNSLDPFFPKYFTSATNPFPYPLQPPFMKTTTPSFHPNPQDPYCPQFTPLPFFPPNVTTFSLSDSSDPRCYQQALQNTTPLNCYLSAPDPQNCLQSPPISYLPAFPPYKNNDKYIY